jgi:outer membrane receptor for ferrienterochelin and colicins
MKNKSGRLIMLLSLLSSSAFSDVQASAQSINSGQSEEIVVTATLNETPVSKVPAAVEVIERMEITESGAATLSDVLTEAQSITLEPTNGRLSVARLRGLNSRNTLVLIDGMRLYGGFQGYLDLGEIPAGMIERIEIIRGSGSALYGSDAIGGVINVITKKPSKDLHAGLNIFSGESVYGEAGSINTNGYISGTQGKLGYVFSGTWNNRDRYDRDKSSLMTDGDDRRSGAYSTSLNYRLTSGVNLSFGINYADTELDGIRTQLQNKVYVDKNRKVEADRLLGYIGLDVDTGTESKLTLRALQSHYDWRSDMQPLAGGAVETTTLEQKSREYEGRWTIKLSDSHRITTGMEYSSEDRSDNGISYDAHNFAAFLQDEVQLAEPLGLVFGARYDDHSDFGNAFSPKVGLWLKLGEHLRLRGSYGEGFRAPTLYELYTGSLTTKNKIIYANPNLDAEKSRSYEIGADGTWGAFSCGVTAFRNDMSDMIGEVRIGMSGSTPVYELRNISSAMTQGLEFTAGFRLAPGLTLSDELTLLGTEDKTTGYDLLYVPDAVNTVKLLFQAGSGFSGNIRVVTTGRQWIDTATRTDPYTLVNCYLGKKIYGNSELFIGADNIFNVEANASYGNSGGPASTGTCFYGGIMCAL